MKENKDFFEWYKQKITENPQDPPEEAWQNIADELDVNDVWDKVAVHLDAPAAWYYRSPWNYALPTLLLLLVSGGGYLIYDKVVRETPAPTVSAYAFADSLSRKDQPREVYPGSTANDSSSLSKESSLESIDDPDKATQDITSDRNLETNQIADSIVENKLTLQASPHSHTSAKENRLKNDGAFQDAIADNASGQQLTRKESISAQESRDSATQIISDQSRTHSQTAFMTQRKADSVAMTVIQNNSISHTAAADDHRLRSGQDETHVPSFAQRSAYPTFMLRPVIVPDSMVEIRFRVATLSFHVFAEADSVQPSTAPRFSPSLEFGISGAIKNTWLLNQTTFAGLERHTLTATLPDFGKNIGVAIRYNFSPRFSAQAEGAFICDIGQRYNEYRKGKYINREVDLNYMHAKLLFKYGNNAMVLDRLVNGHGIIGGFYFGKLLSASETIDNATMEVGDTYARLDYGIVIGYEYNQRLFSNFYFTSGVRLNYGLKNIRPAAITKTATGSFDVDLGLRYRF